jgi:hypothetical protein
VHKEFENFLNKNQPFGINFSKKAAKSSDSDLIFPRKMNFFSHRKNRPTHGWAIPNFR